MFSILKRALSWAITSFGNKFCLKKRSRLINVLDNRFYVKFMQLEKVYWFRFYLSEPRVLAEAAGCKSYFALTPILQNKHFHMWRDLLMKYSSLKYSEFILAFQVQFGTYEAESGHFR